MEENQLSEQMTAVKEPENISDNSQKQSAETETVSEKPEGQSTNDPSELLLGKFKSVDDLSKAYQELERLQGVQSAELGSLRENANVYRVIREHNDEITKLQNASEELKQTAQKYSSYFADPSFRQIYGNAFLALGDKLDTDRLVNLLEGYVSSRIFAHEKSKAEQAETKRAINGLAFDKNEEKQPVKNSFAGKRINDMTPKEIDELLETMI
jgi:hypothetical protein